MRSLWETRAGASPLVQGRVTEVGDREDRGSTVGISQAKKRTHSRRWKLEIRKSSATSRSGNGSAIGNEYRKSLSSSLLKCSAHLVHSHLLLVLSLPSIFLFNDILFFLTLKCKCSRKLMKNS